MMQISCVRMVRVGVLMLGLLSVGSALAATAAPPLAAAVSAFKPESVLPAKNVQYQFFDLIGAQAGNPKAQLELLPEPSSGLGYRATVPVRGKQSYEVEAKIVVPAALKKGDVAMVRFMARSLVARQESGEGSVGIGVGRLVAPHERSLAMVATPGPEWTLYEVPFVNNVDYPAGQAGIMIALADLVQTVEITYLELLNFGNRATVAQLPQLRFTYKGREADAPWRAAALQRIEQIRTAPLAIRVTDSHGKPVAGAQVKAELVESEFVWGTAVSEAMLGQDLPDSPKYRAVLQEFFNTAVIENGFKWEIWGTDLERRKETVRVFEWLAQSGMRQRGHNLVWPGWKFAPKFAKELAERDPAAFKKAIEDDIDSKMPLTKGRMIAWDVINEILHERDFLPFLPEDAPVQWFKRARAIDPSAKLVLNDYAMLNSARSPGTIASFRDVVQSMRKAGAPIDALGIQGHIGQQPRAPESVLSDLDMIAQEGLPVQIT